MQRQAADQAIKEERSGILEENPLDHQREPDGQATESDWLVEPGDQRVGALSLCF
jgi:hypothetical protein